MDSLKLRFRLKDGHAVVDIGDLMIDGVHRAEIVCAPPDYRPRLILELTEFLCELDTDNLK